MASDSVTATPPSPLPSKPGMNLRQKATLGVVAAIIIVAFLIGGKLFETVKKGTYQIKQAAITGTMSAKMDPGMHIASRKTRRSAAR